MTDDKDAFEFLERLEIAEEHLSTKAHFREIMSERFFDAGLGKPSSKQLSVTPKMPDFIVTWLFPTTELGGL